MVDMTWVSFDVLARNAATGAHVAMWLRQRLPAAMIRSEPAESPSEDPERPHKLRCLACISGVTGAGTRQALEAALRDLDAIGESRVRVAFHEDRSPEAAAEMRRASSD